MKGVCWDRPISVSLYLRAIRCCGHSRSDVTLDIYTTVTKELKQREFGNFEEKMKQQKQEQIHNLKSVA